MDDDDRPGRDKGAVVVRAVGIEYTGVHQDDAGIVVVGFTMPNGSGLYVEMTPEVLAKLESNLEEVRVLQASRRGLQ